MNPVNRPRRHHRTRLSRSVRLVLLGTAALLLSLVALPAAVATASTTPANPQTDTGWIRIGHLSAGTEGVDVRLSPFAGGGPIDLTDIVYGEFSDYARVPAGLYTVAVRPTGSAMSVEPMIDQSVEVGAGGAATVVATRSGDGVVARVVQDDLTPPASGQAKVRLISGAVEGEAVSARVVDGPVLAEELTPGADTGYAAVPAGTWPVELLVDGARSSLNQVPLRAGAVYTLLVADGPGDSVELQAVQDSASSSVMPAGGVDTGGGALSAVPGSAGPVGVPTVWSVLGGLGAVLAILVSRVRRVRTRELG